MASFESVPSSVLAYFITPYIESPKDLLSLRATCKTIHKNLHEGEESDEIWRHFLVRDFHFHTNDSKSNEEDNDPNLIDDYLDTLKVISVYNQHGTNYTVSSMSQESDITACSIFGYKAKDSVYRTESIYDSWRQWNIAKRKYYEGCIDIDKKTMNAPYFLRAARMWAKIELWCQNEKHIGRQVLHSLAHGVTYSKGRFKDCNEPGIHAFGAIFAFYDGQAIQSSASSLFGGYCCYDDFVSMVMTTSDEPPFRKSTSSRKYIAINLNLRRFIHINCHNGQLYLSDRKLNSTSDHIPCVSKPSEHDQYDSGLIWMENFARQLEHKEIEVGTCVLPGHHNAKRILLHYPTLKCRGRFFGDEDQLPIVSNAVTRGIEVTASSHFDPVTVDWDLHDHRMVSYSIRIRIVPQGEDGYMPESDRGYKSCQLISRHWIIVDGETGQEETVNGPGVIGMFPLLYDLDLHRVDYVDNGNVCNGEFFEERLFRYQSYVNATSKSFRGTLMFIPGSIETPTGEPFAVEVAPFAIVTGNEIIY